LFHFKISYTYKRLARRSKEWGAEFPLFGQESKPSSWFQFRENQQLFPPPGTLEPT